MLSNSKQSIKSGDNSVNLNAGGDIYILANAPTELIDQKIEEEVEKLRQSRFFTEFDSTGFSSRLGIRLIEGNLSNGSVPVRGRALAWCARILSRSKEELPRADELLKLANTHGDFTECKVAEAIIESHKGNKAGALKKLAEIHSDLARTASLIVVGHHDGPAKALDWIDVAGYTAKDLDSEGKSLLLSYQLHVGHWDKLTQTVQALSGEDLNHTPILHYFLALATLAPALARDLRAVVMTQVPFNTHKYPLASNAAAMDARRSALKHFLNAMKAAEQLDCPRAAKAYDEYALWLELRDPEYCIQGKNRLENKLRDPNQALGFVHFALHFGIKLDLNLVERDIERSIAINGGMTMDAAIARFALAFTQQTPEEVANYISRHFIQLTDYIDPKLLLNLQIEMLSRAGLKEKAYEVLNQLLAEGIPADQELNLRRIISETEGNVPLESRKAQYETTGELHDLINLVAELQEQEHWDDLCNFGRQLFEETRSLGDAESLVNAFNNTQNSKKLVNFLDENDEFLAQSSFLRMSYAWGLYNEGEFLRAREALASLGDSVASPNYRALQVNLGIATGDWASISAFIADEYQNRKDRSPPDLIGVAQLALHLGSPYAKDLLFEAVAKAKDDPSVLASAYFLATNAGWEDDSQITHWIEKAAELSSEDGPIQMMSLKDILDQKPEWDRRESETWRMLAHAEIPIFMAAQSLNRTLIDLTTFPALANLSQPDLRKRSAIPTYSGRRVPLHLAAIPKVIAIDPTALLTLSFLEILDLALDAFETIHIPHSTLSWLFEENHKAAFHQPSRIADAHKIRDLIAIGALEKFTPSTVPSSDLAAQVGDELAALIAEAEKVRVTENRQCIVVRSAPVHRLSSLMEEEADLSAHAEVLSSCLSVVEKLRQKGHVTANEAKRARAYLQLHEKPWLHQPNIADDAIFYLDDLAVTYLQHLRLLEKFRLAGFKTVLSPRVVLETDALISYESNSKGVKKVIENIRASLSSRISSGQVKVGSRSKPEEFREKNTRDHPSIGIFALSAYCEAVIIDDRFLNQHRFMDSRGHQVPVISTLDLLDSLVASNRISDEDRLEHRTRLRQASHFFVPISEIELERYLRESSISNGKVVESAELKAIRESIIRIRMSDWLRLPNEAPWIDGTMQAYVRTLKGLWVNGADLERSAICSNWLLMQLDMRRWAQSLLPEIAEDVVRNGHSTLILSLLIAPANLHQKVLDAYWNWVEERILEPIHEESSELYEWLLDWYRKHLATIAETEIPEVETAHEAGQ